MAESADLDQPGTRRQLALVAAGLLIVVAVLSVVYFAVFRTNYVVLFSRLRPADAAAVVSELQKDKTPYRLTDKGTTILVPAELADASRLDVVSTDIPLKGAVGFELFNKSDMGLTDFAQKINYQRALQGELARTIMTLSGVESARIHLSLAEQGIFQRDRGVAKASVTVIMQLGRTLPPAAVNGIQNLVASAVADLSAADVVVLDAQGNVISSILAAASATATPVIQQKLAIEQYYAGKIRQALQDDERAAGAQVMVLALIDPLNADPAPTFGPEGVPMVGRPTGDIFSDSFSPQARHFGLRAILTFAQILHPDEQHRIVDLAHAAIGFDASKGDDVEFGVPVREMPPTSGFEGQAADTYRSDNGNLAVKNAGDPSRWLWVALGALVIVAAVVVLAWLLLNRRLSPGQRRAFAAQLSHELDRMEANA